MPITGGSKFFDLTTARTSLATAAASTGNTSAGKVLDGNIYTKWSSVGSNDATTETLTVTFSPAITLNRMALANMNWKAYGIKYSTGGAYTAFTNVLGLDAALVGINETAFADPAAYYEFDTVTGVTSIQFTITTTQVANQDKYLFKLFTMNEIGTFVGFPTVSSSNHSRNERAKKTASEKYKVQKSYRTAQFGLTFATYPTDLSYQADIILIQTLFDLETPFTVWLCGGRRGQTYFRHSIYGYFLKDFITMNITGGWNPVFRLGVYINGVNATLTLVEAVP